MRPRSQVLILAAALVLTGLARAASNVVYDEKADAPKQVLAAIAEASRRGKHVVLVFGANWCPDCFALEAQIHRPELTAIIEKNYLVVKVNVGRMDKNLELARKYGVPIRRGIPALAVLDPQGKLLFAQDQGQFADARHLGLESIKTFFEQWKPRELDLPRLCRGALPYQDQRGGKLPPSAGQPLAFAIRCPEWAVRCATPGRRPK